MAGDDSKHIVVRASTPFWVINAVIIAVSCAVLTMIRVTALEEKLRMVQMRLFESAEPSTRPGTGLVDGFAPLQQWIFGSGPGFTEARQASSVILESNADQISTPTSDVTLENQSGTDACTNERCDPSAEISGGDVCSLRNTFADSSVGPGDDDAVQE